MRGLSDTGLLELWESGHGRHPLDRALLCLAATAQGEGGEDLADWPLGRRDRALLELRRQCFGDRMHGWTACRACGEKLEFEMDARSLAEEAVDPVGRLVVKGREARLPTSRDLALAVAERDPVQASIKIVERCLGAPPAPGDWSVDDLEEIGDEMAKADPFAEVRILQCPGCGRTWEEVFEIASFLWKEIEARARMLLHDVHALTLAYGWREAEILSLSDCRRAAYVSMVRA